MNTEAITGTTETQTTLSPSDLALDVYERSREATESFCGDDGIGGNTAYLMAAILKGGSMEVSRFLDEPFWKMLRTQFPVEHPVWGFVELVDDEVVELEPCLREAEECNGCGACVDTKEEVAA